MNRIVAAALVAVCAVMGLARPAEAAARNTPFSISLGVSFPNQGEAKQVGGSDQFALNTSYAVTPTTSRSGSLYLFLDYTTGGANGASNNNIGGGVGYRLNTPIYAGFDLGAYGTSVSFTGFAPVPEGSPPRTFTVSEGTTGVGGRVYVGANLTTGRTPAVYLEGGYRFLPSVAGIDPSGWGVGLGVRL